jgi:hypothetical protein
MSLFVTPTEAPEARSAESRHISLFYAGILVVMVLAQLFTFETFLELIGSFGLPGGLSMAYVLTAILVASEVFALPFLLRMVLSPAFRWLSMACGVLVGALWVFLSSWVVIGGATVTTIGFLGTVVETMPGWWAVLLSVALLLLGIWSAWGLWPGKRDKAKRKR